MIDTTLMGPGFFVFFQRNEIISGGYFPPYIPKVRYKFKDEEEKEAAEIVEDLIVLQPENRTQDDLEIMLRMKLQHNEIRYRKLYLNWLFKEYKKYAIHKRKRRNSVTALLLLH